MYLSKLVAIRSTRTAVPKRLAVASSAASFAPFACGVTVTTTWLAAVSTPHAVPTAPACLFSAAVDRGERVRVAG